MYKCINVITGKGMLKVSRKRWHENPFTHTSNSGNLKTINRLSNNKRKFESGNSGNKNDHPLKKSTVYPPPVNSLKRKSKTDPLIYKRKNKQLYNSQPLNMNMSMNGIVYIILTLTIQ